MRSLLALGAFVLAASADADVLNVPGDFPTIQAAVDAAQDGDEIVLAPGMYGIPPLEITRGISLTIRSEDPSDRLLALDIMFQSFVPIGIIRVEGSLSEPIDVTFAGVSFLRESPQTSTSSIVIRGATARFEGCFFLGGTSDDPQGEILAAFDGIDGSPSAVTIDACEFALDVGRLRFQDTTVTMSDALVRDGTFGISWDSQGNDTFTLTDSRFRNVMRSGNVLSFGSGTQTPQVLIERTEFDAIPGGLLRGRSVTLRDVTIENSGRSVDGSFFLEADTLDIDGLTVRDCDTQGNPISFVQAREQLVARNVVFEDNTGASIWLHGLTDEQPGGFVIEDSEFRNNSAVDIIAEGHHSGVFRRCTFERNAVQSTGTVSVFGRGNRGNLDDAVVTVEDCVFRYNTGGLAPFAIARAPGTVPVVFRGCRFEGNREGFFGGASTGFGDRLSNFYGEWVAFEQCIFVGNGGLIGGINGDAARYESSVLVENAGGETLLGTGTTTLLNTTLLVNNHDTPVVGDVSGGTANFPSEVSGTFSIVPTTVAGTNTTSLDPLFVRPPTDGGDGWGDDPLTPDIDESLNDDFGDLRLRAGSPAIDAGTNDFFMPGDTDLAGNPRLADDPGIPGNNVDIGAYEFQGTTCLADVNQDGQLTPNDFNAWILAFNASSPLADQNRDGEVRQNDFNAWILNFNRGC
ncbi:MAG: right-handed parallel beta-helix repeat-containing protein [Planctomycetota bacterium]